MLCTQFGDLRLLQATALSIFWQIPQFVLIGVQCPLSLILILFCAQARAKFSPA